MVIWVSITQIFAASDPAYVLALVDPRGQHSLRGFLLQLDSFSNRWCRPAGPLAVAMTGPSDFQAKSPGVHLRN